MSPADWAALSATALCLVPAELRWLRVAQREHYLSSSVGRFAGRWWVGWWPNRLLGAAAVLAAALTAWTGWAALATAAVVAAGPLGLSLRGRTSELRWTRRLATLAALCVALSAGLVFAGGRVAAAGDGTWLLALVALGSPLVVELALSLTGPLEDLVGRRWIDRAQRRLQALRPVVVAVTGSFGKTSTKGYIAHLCSSSYSVVASPKSFNNAMGLARTVNQHLPPGTEVLVAEMGTYGSGEIASMCRWMKPRIAVITAIGPVHLERFGTQERIAQAKGEIFKDSQVAVCNIDYELLKPLVESARQRGQRVWTCSGDPDSRANVVVSRQGGGAALWARPPDGSQACSATIDSLNAAPGNLACALAVALELGVPWEAAVSRCRDLPQAPHRLQAASNASGVDVLDDTYNSNPAGAAMALRELAGSGRPGGRRVVVTPGMVELGRCQARENQEFAAAAAGKADALVVVGRTNLAALVSGWRAGGGGQLVVVGQREQAVAWVAAHLAGGDAVLYENDLPDHYP